MKRKLSVFLDAVMAISCALPCQPHHRGVSPRITVTNNSSVPVALDVIYTSVDLGKLPGAVWGTDPNVAPMRSPSASRRRRWTTRCRLGLV